MKYLWVEAAYLNASTVTNVHAPSVIRILAVGSDQNGSIL